MVQPTRAINPVMGRIIASERRNEELKAFWGDSHTQTYDKYTEYRTPEYSQSEHWDVSSYQGAGARKRQLPAYTFN